MGTNARYAYLSAQRAEERDLLAASKRGPLGTLSDDQLRLHARVVSIAPERPPLWGLAWLRFGDVDVRATVRVRRWTADAVGVEFDLNGTTMRCWVWQGACDRLARREDAWT